MTAVVPPRFFFRFAWPVRRAEHVPAASGPPLNLAEDHRGAMLGAVDGGNDFADIRLAWNERGFGMSIEVRGKNEPLVCLPMSPQSSDGVTVWLDTRSTQNVHRATRYCHQFIALPTGAGKKKEAPSMTSVALGSRQEVERTPARQTDASIQIWSELYDDGYRLEVWWPAASLVGFDPETHRQLGFYAVVRDAELGEQFLTVGREFPFEHDPSLWQMLELVD